MVVVHIATTSNQTNYLWERCTRYAPEGVDDPALGGEVEQPEEELDLVGHLRGGHPVDAPEVAERLGDRELGVQGKLLWRRGGKGAKHQSKSVINQNSVKRIYSWKTKGLLLFAGQR